MPRCESAIHLGHLLHTKDTNNATNGDVIEGFHRISHGFLARFGSCNTTTKNKLFHQYCQSIYGSQLWPMTSPSVHKLCTQWREHH